MNKDIIKPSFYILGVQKGGTSTLHNYLKQSNQIYFPKNKEVHFFDKHFKLGFEWYYNNFKVRQANDYKISGEATPYYFFQPFLPKLFSKSFPNAKFILVLRNPIDRAFSHYQMSVRRNIEIQTFEKAIKKENWIIRKEYLKMFFTRKHSFIHKEKSYISRGFYHKQLQRWLKHYPLSNFLIIKSEDLFTKPTSELDKICDFLKVDRFTIEKLEIINEGAYKDQLTKSTQTKLENIYKHDITKLEHLIQKEFKWF